MTDWVNDFREIDVDPTNPNRIYVASNSGIWVFNGSNWTIRNEQHGLTKNIFGHLTFQFIAVDPLNPNIIYAGQNDCWSGISAGIFRSTDYGQTWENINFNFGPDLTIWAITVSPYDSSVWIGTDYGN